jgi:hypothetical protein
MMRAVPFHSGWMSQHFTTYSMTIEDKLWSASLATRFVYEGSAVHFVRTSLPLQMGDKTVQGSVYQAEEKPDVFYVVNGDAMLKLGTTWAYNPGVGRAELRKQLESGGKSVSASVPAKNSVLSSDWIGLTVEGQEKTVRRRSSSRGAAQLQCVTRASEAAVNQGCSPSSRLV